ncbi:MAG: hypothetical protein H8E92_06685 [SAR86 cluster bacterium]|nr:hypothetical protein [SAR86 cluster bacterium]
MDVLEQLLSLSNIMLCLAIVALVWVHRKGMEILFSSLLKRDLKKYKIWREFFVPLGPIGTGMLLMLIPGVPVPEMFTSSSITKMVFGVGLGLISGLVFRMVKKLLMDKMGKEDKPSAYIE